MMAAQRHTAKIFLDLGDDADNTPTPESACRPASAGASAPDGAVPAAVKTSQGPPAVRFPSTATTADSTQLGIRPVSPGSPESASTMLLDLTAPAAPAAASDDTPPLYAPPDASEGPEAAEEYAAYLKRWAAGSTLHQRFQR